MILLAVLALLLFALTLWWLTRPLRSAPVVAVASERTDLESLRDRLMAQLNELDAERADRGIDATIGREEELRLSAELAETLKRLEGLGAATGSAAVDVTRRKPWPAAIALSTLMLLSAGLYLWLNTANLQGYVQAARSGVDNKRLPPMVFEMVAKLEKRLEQQPNDPEGWARLGRSYLVLEQRDKARSAYAKAYEQAPDNIDVLSDYAWLVFNDTPGDVSGLAMTLYQRLHKLAPEHPDALWFMGYSTYQKGDARGALRYWERLAKLLPPGSSELAELSHAMQAVRNEMAGKKNP